MLRDPKKFTITRSKWLYGGGAGTQIIDEKGNKDCFGFFLAASGLDESQMIGLHEPLDVFRKHENWYTKLIQCIGNVRFQTQICNQIITTNDHIGLSLPEREDQITKLFDAISIRVEFED